jgi:3-hydroxyisobutyrate dehydrogenase-like beta-hydroxyacid dehydrogenase
MVDFSVGVVGLDSMGAALSRRLDEQGIGNTPTDLNTRMLQAHLAEGGSAPAGSPFDLAQVCDLVLIAETTNETLREAVLGPIGLAHALRPGTIIVDMSDASPQTGPALARALYSKGAIWIEATPVGTAQNACDGTLTLLTSGPADALERVAPVLRAFAAKILRLGELGSGPLVKALVSALGVTSAAVYTEAMLVAKKGGLDPAGILAALPLLAPGMGTPPVSLATEVLTGRYRSGIPGNRVQGDFATVLDAARTTFVPVPIMSLVHAAMTSAGHSPRATGDHMDLARWMAEQAGIEFGGARE